MILAPKYAKMRLNICWDDRIFDCIFQLRQKVAYLREGNKRSYMKRMSFIYLLITLYCNNYKSPPPLPNSKEIMYFKGLL